MAETNAERLADWYDAHGAQLTLYARQFLDAAGAEDVVQEVFLKLLARPSEPERVRAWLFTAVRNEAISARRSLQRSVQRERSAAAERREWFERHPGDLMDAAAAERAMAGLPEAQREIIVLRLWGGLTLTEAAGVLGEPVSTLFSRYRVGLSEIRRQLEMTSCKKRT